MKSEGNAVSWAVFSRLHRTKQQKAMSLKKPTQIQVTTSMNPFISFETLRGLGGATEPRRGKMKV